MTSSVYDVTKLPETTDRQLRNFILDAVAQLDRQHRRHEQLEQERIFRQMLIRQSNLIQNPQLNRIESEASRQTRFEEEKEYENSALELISFESINWMAMPMEVVKESLVESEESERPVFRPQIPSNNHKSPTGSD